MLQSFDPRNADILINVAGELMHRDVARVSPFDSVVQGGDGAVLRDPAEAPVGGDLRIRLAGGDLAATAAGPWTADRPAPGGRPRPGRTRRVAP